MSEEELRQEAVRRRLAGESPIEIAEALGSTTRLVRKWVARHDENGYDDGWAEDRSRAPHHSPTKLDDTTRDLILAARKRLVANPRAQYGALAIPWELRRIGVTDIPPAWTIERVVIRVPMEGDDNQATIRPGEATQVALTAWDGAQGNRGGRKHWSSWVAMEVEQAS